MKTLPILNSMLVLASGAGLSAQQANAQQKPHIILIMSDQHRADALGCMGNESVISPNIDQLSREGTFVTAILRHRVVRRHAPGY